MLVDYTPAYNLLKTEDMEVGAVSFKNPKLVSRPRIIITIMFRFIKFKRVKINKD